MIEFKKTARLIALVLGTFITAGMFFIPMAVSMEAEQMKFFSGNIDKWLILYTMIIMFYFNAKEEIT